MAVAIMSACFMSVAVFSAQVFLEGESLWSPPEQGQARRGAKRLKSGGAEQVAADPLWRNWAVQAAEALKDRLGVEVAADDLSVKAVSPDDVGNVHVRLAQQYKGVPVRGNQLIVHFRESGAAYVVNGDFLPGIELDPEPTIPCPPGGVLMVWSPPGASDASSARLAWRIPQGANWVYRDARTGDALAVERRSRRADSDEEYDEEWLYDYAVAYAPKARTLPFPAGVPCMIRGQLPRPLWTNDAPCMVEVPGIKGNDGYYYLCGKNAAGREFAIWNAEGVADAYRSAPGRVAPLPSAADANALARYSSADWGDYHPEAIAAARHLITVMDYYQGEFGRATYLGTNNVRTCAFVCLPEKDAKGKVVGGYDNAFFISDVDGSAPGAEPLNSGAMYFGYDSSDATSFQVLDVTVHEFSHGIAGSTADFLYDGESGALDESFADIFGVSCENLHHAVGPAYPSFAPQTIDWFIGEDMGLARPLRDLLNPSSSFATYPQPSTYRDSYWADTTPYSEDGGGVHSNSGVQNRFFHLLQGRIGLRPALQIAYHVVTRYCSSQTGYAEVSRLWPTAAADLAGRSVNGVEIPADAASIAASLWAGLMAKPSYSATQKRIFIGYIVEAGLVVMVTVGKESKGKLPLKILFVAESGRYKSFSKKAEVVNGVASVDTSYGKMTFDLAADNIRCSWDVAKEILADPTEPLNLDFMVMHRTPEFLSSIADELPAEAFVGVRLEVPLYKHLLYYWIDYLAFSGKTMPRGLSVKTRTGLLSGVPSKAKKGTATLTVKSGFTKCKQTYKWSYSFVALPSWAYGSFSAELKNGGVKVGDVSIKVTSAGGISGKIKMKDGAWKMSTKGYASVTGAGEAFQVDVKAKRGGRSTNVALDVTPAGMAGSMVIDGVRYTFLGTPKKSAKKGASR